MEKFDAYAGQQHKVDYYLGCEDLISENGNEACDNQTMVVGPDMSVIEIKIDTLCSLECSTMFP